MKFRLFFVAAVWFFFFGKLNAQPLPSCGETKDIQGIKELLSKYYGSYNIEPEKALGYAREALTLSEKISYQPGKAEAMQCIGIYFQDRLVNVKGSMDSAERYFNKSLFQYRSLRDQPKVLETLILIAGNSAIRRNYPQMEQQYIEALQLAERLGDKESVELCYIGLELAYKQMEDKEKELEYTIKIKSLKKPSNEEEEVRLLYKLGDLCMEKGSCKRALPFYYEAHRLLQLQRRDFLTEELRRKIEKALNQCSSEERMKNDTLSSFQKSFEVYRTLSDTTRMIRTLNQMASFFSDKKEAERAIPCLQQSLSLAKVSRNTEAEAFAYITLARIYVDQNRTAEAQQYFSQSKKLYEILVNERTVKQIAAMEAGYEAEKKKQAIREVEKDKELLAGQNKIQQLQLKEAIYEQERKQQILLSVTKDKELLSKRNKVQELEISQQRYMIYGMMALFVLAFVLVVLIVRQSRLKSRYRQLEAEQKALRAQMNPHFIFNALISIQNFIYRNDSKEAVSYLGKFSGLMRLILENSREELVSLESEIKLLDYYLSLEQLRMEQKFEYSIQYAALETEMIYLPSMLLQPFAENAIVHAFKGIDYPGRIEIQFEVLGEVLICTIADNGIGRVKAEEYKKENNPHRSLSTQIMEERTQVYARKYKKEITVSVSDRNDVATGTIVRIEIPL